MAQEFLYKKANDLFRNKKYFEALSIYQKIKEKKISIFIDKDIERCKNKINNQIIVKKKYLFYGSISENKLNIVSEIRSNDKDTNCKWISDAEFKKNQVFFNKKSIELNIELEYISNLKTDKTIYQFTENEVKDILGYYEKIPSGRRPFGSTSLNTNNLNLWLNSLINEIDKFKPDIFFIWLQFKPFNYKLIDICRNKNIKIRFIHEGFIPGSISIEENGMMAESKQTEEYPKSINIDRKYLKNAASILSHLKIKKYERKPSSKNTSKLISEKYILVCGSNDEECGIKYGGIKRFFKHSPLGINSLELVKIVCEYGYLKNYKVIYKPHPNLAANQNYKTSKEFERLKDLNNKYKNLLEIIYEGDLYQLIENSILNVTLTSAVAYNCCFIDAPVAIFGKLPLSNKNCCYEVKDINQISRIFDDAIIHKTKEIHKANFLLHIAHLLSTNLYWSESSPIYSSGKNFKDSSYKNCLEPLSNFSRIFEKKYLIENDPHTSKINYLNQLINPNHNKKSLNIVFLCLFPREGYSGGRFHAFCFAHALAKMGNEVNIISKNKPIYTRDNEKDYFSNEDFKYIWPPDEYTKLLKNQKIKAPDLVITVPDSNISEEFKKLLNLASYLKINYKDTLISFLEFESNSLWNKTNPYAKDYPKNWESWNILASYSDKVISSSKVGQYYASKSYYQKNYGDIECIYAPIWTRASSILSEQKQENLILCFVRESVPHKGTKLLEQIFCSEISGWKVILVGQLKKETINKFKNMSSKFNFEITFLKNCLEVTKWRLLHQAKVMLYPSDFEGFGLPPIEALFAGVDVICKPIPTLLETIKNCAYFSSDLSDESYISKVKQYLTKSLPEINDKLPKNVILDYRLYGAYLEMKFRTMINEKKQSQLIKQMVYSKNKVVLFWPPIKEALEEIDTHYFRAEWYLRSEPKNSINKIKIYLPSFNKNIKKEVPLRPNYFGTEKHKFELNLINFDDISFAKCIEKIKPDLILLWDEKTNINDLKKDSKIKIMDVRINKEESKEYGNYAKVQWELMNNNEQKNIVELGFKNFMEFSKNVKTDRSFIFCTGPSIDSCNKFDISNSLKIGCNTVILDDQLYRNLNIDILCAGDVVSHFGVSLYAEEFRRILRKRMLEDNLYFFSTAMFGSTILLSNPELKDRIILCNQGIDGGHINLIKKWSLPKLDSTLNIHMLPIAATLTKNINLLGVDGQSKEKKNNEDFWAHSKTAQMHNLVETGHLSHPTFAANREFRKDLNVSTIDRYSESCRESTQLGIKYGRKYRVLCNTFTDSLKPFVGKDPI